MKEQSRSPASSAQKQDCLYDIETRCGSEDRAVNYHCHSQNAAQGAREEIDRVLLKRINSSTR